MAQIDPRAAGSPIDILEQEAARLDAMIPNAGMGSTWRDAKQHLFDYEQTQGVTFMALDTASLMRFFEAWQDVSEAADFVEGLESQTRLMRAITDLMAGG